MITQEQSEHFWARVDIRGDECWLWKGAINHNGYGVVRISGRLYRCHRLVWELSSGNLQPSELVLHQCDTRNCCNPRHLFTGSHADNQHDCIKKGRARKAIGSSAAGAKLDDPTVVKIRKLYAAGVKTHTGLAREFGVSKTCIGSILTRQTWKHLPE